MILRIRTPQGGNFDIPLGPGSPASWRSTYDARPAANVGEMVPVMHGGAPKQRSDGTRKAFSIIPANRYAEPKHDDGRKERVVLLCRAAMRYGESCARASGHRDSHRSRLVMDAETARRRSTRAPRAGCPR